MDPIYIFPVLLVWKYKRKPKQTSFLGEIMGDSKLEHSSEMSKLSKLMTTSSTDNYIIELPKKESLPLNVRLSLCLMPCLQKNKKYYSIDCCQLKHESIIEHEIPIIISIFGLLKKKFYRIDCVNENNKAMLYINLTIKLILCMVQLYINLFTIMMYYMKGYSFGTYFIYFIEWINILLCLYYIISIIIIIKIKHKYITRKLTNHHIFFIKTHIFERVYPDIYRLYSITTIILKIVLPTLCVLIIHFYAFVFDYNINLKDDAQVIMLINDVQTHGINLLLLLIDFAISLKKLYYKDMIYGGLFCIIFGIWTFVFSFSNLETENNQTFVYELFNWKDEPYKGIASLISLMIVTIVAHIILVFTKNYMFIHWYEYFSNFLFTFSYWNDHSTT